MNFEKLVDKRTGETIHSIKPGKFFDRKESFGFKAEHFEGIDEKLSPLGRKPGCTIILEVLILHILPIIAF